MVWGRFGIVRNICYLGLHGLRMICINFWDVNAVVHIEVNVDITAVPAGSRGNEIVSNSISV